MLFWTLMLFTITCQFIIIIINDDQQETIEYKSNSYKSLLSLIHFDHCHRKYLSLKNYRYANNVVKNLFVIEI